MVVTQKLFCDLQRIKCLHKKILNTESFELRLVHAYIFLHNKNQALLNKIIIKENKEKKKNYKNIVNHVRGTENVVNRNTVSKV